MKKLPLVLLLIYFLFGCSTSKSTDFSAPVRKAPCGKWLESSGKVAPPFALNGFDGKPYALSYFRGRPVILAFWASWCLPCKMEMVELNYLFSSTGSSKLVVVGIGSHDDLESLKRFAREHNLSFPLLYDAAGDISSTYGVSGLPHTVIVGEDGTLMNICSASEKNFHPFFKGNPSDLIEAIRGYIEEKA